MLDTLSEVAKILNVHRKVVYWALKRGTVMDAARSGRSVSVVASQFNKTEKENPVRVTEKHQKADLGAECVGDNNEKGPQDVPREVSEKTWTDGSAEKGMVGKISAGVGRGHEWGTLGKCLHR